LSAPLSLLFGSIVGLSLGLTGGGGALFAVPLLVYGLHLDVRAAASVSLAAVGLISMVGAWQRWRAGQVEVATGLVFAAGGMLGAPVGVGLAQRVPEPLLLSLFAALMLVVAFKMWRDAGAQKSQPAAEPEPLDEALTHPKTQPNPQALVPLGLACGVLSGMFGVGGGFVIVPSLVLFASTPLVRAVGTSLMVITLVSISAELSHLWAGHGVPLEVTTLFVLGGVVGLNIGQRLAARLAAPVLQRVFVLVLLGVAGLVLLHPPSSRSPRPVEPVRPALSPAPSLRPASSPPSRG
jgi:uncharacterized protein